MGSTRTVARTNPLVALAGLLVALILSVALLLNGSPASGATVSTPSPTASAEPAVEAVLTLYWGDGCPNCEKERQWLETVQAENPDLTIVQHEVWGDADNRELFVAEGERLGFEASSVPTTVIGERVWIGWTGQIEEDMADAVDLVVAGEAPPPGVYGTAGAGTCSKDATECSAEADAVTIDVPFFGEVNLGDQSLLVSTLIIGFVDGVNPCSLWVISVLLTIVIRTASRRRVIAVGATFLGVTAAMYAVFMFGIYSALSVVGSIGKIQIIVAIAALIFGVVSLKDYFAFKKWFSFSIADSAKPGIYKRARNAAGQKALIPALLATVALAVAVSLLETPCTAGFPVLWTGMLQANGVGFAESAGLFVVYMIPFLLDEFIVFAIAIVTMRASKMQEKHGELLKLIGGVTMIALAGVMIFNPTLMESPIGALALFVIAFFVAWLIHMITLRVKAARDKKPAVEDASLEI